MYMNDTEYRKFKNSRFYGYFDLLKEEIARLGQMGVQFLFSRHHCARILRIYQSLNNSGWITGNLISTISQIVIVK